MPLPDSSPRDVMNEDEGAAVTSLIRDPLLGHATCQKMDVAGNLRKFRSAAQLVLQFENSLVLINTGNLGRQVICNHAHSALGDHLQGSRLKHFSQAIKG